MPRSLPTTDKIVVYVHQESSTCDGPGRCNRSDWHQSVTFPSAECHFVFAPRLKAKGVQAADDPASADCTVGYSIGARTIVEGEMYPDWGWGWRGGGYVGAWDYPYVYKEGRIAVDVYDAKSHQPIWHASVNEDVTELTGASAQAKIDAAVGAIFAKFL